MSPPPSVRPPTRGCLQPFPCSNNPDAPKPCCVHSKLVKGNVQTEGFCIEQEWTYKHWSATAKGRGLGTLQRVATFKAKLDLDWFVSSREDRVAWVRTLEHWISATVAFNGWEVSESEFWHRNNARCHCALRILFLEFAGDSCHWT